MSEKPVMHGRDHRPGGMDPIPNFGSTWALYGGNGGSTVTISDTTSIGIDWWTWGPSSQSLFSLGAGAGGLSSLGALQVNQDGVYKISFFFGISGTTGDTFDIGFPGEFANWVMPNTRTESYGKITLDPDPVTGQFYVAFERMQFIGGSLSFAAVAPWVTVPSVHTLPGNSAFTVQYLEILVELMSVDYGTSLGVGGIP